MDYSNAYAVLYKAEQFKEKEVLVFFEEKEKMEELIKGLQEKRTITNQKYSYFAQVFDKGAVYPVDCESFWQERRNPNRKNLHIGAGFYVQRTLKNGKDKGKFYQMAEDFDWQLSEWIEKGCTNIHILNLSEAHNGEYYYDREITKKWNEKEFPLVN